MVNVKKRVTRIVLALYRKVDELFIPTENRSLWKISEEKKVWALNERRNTVVLIIIECFRLQTLAKLLDAYVNTDISFYISLCYCIKSKYVARWKLLSDLSCGLYLGTEKIVKWWCESTYSHFWTWIKIQYRERDMEPFIAICSGTRENGVHTERVFITVVQFHCWIGDRLF